MIKKEDYEKILNGNQGTILNDFNSLLRFIEEKGQLTLTKSETAFSMTDLPSLNKILSNPQTTGLSRPQQKAFPYINCLFLLLRLSSLSFVKKEKTKSVIQINIPVLDSWRQLKPVEQYGHLLTYLCHPKANTIIGERSMNLLENIQWLHKDKKRILEYINNRTIHSFTAYHLAALELFGMLSIKPAAPKEGTGWNFQKVTTTPFGDDMFKLIPNALYKTFDLFSMDTLFSKIKSLFPDWKAFIEVPKKKLQSGVHVFKISLGDVWRRIAIKGDLDLHSLSDVILQAFEFDDDHLHEFSYKNQYGLIEKICHLDCDNEFSSDQVLIGKLNLQVGSEMTYLFDFGDMWRFRIVLEELNPEGLNIKKATLLKKHGKAPLQYEY
jgi:Plasmid pRiA4b ORF-3-like protein